MITASCIRNSALPMLVLAWWASVQPASAQNAGDYRSAGSGNWSTTSSWERYDGSSWSVPASPPASADPVFVQSGHVITLTRDEACGDLHIARGVSSGDNTKGIVSLSVNTLNVSGRLRCYHAAVGVTPGTSTTSGYGSYPFTGSSGAVRIVGISRNMTNTGEWSATITNAASGIFPLVIDPDPAQTITMQTNVKATSWTISSGTLDASASVLHADIGTSGFGDITIAAGATLVSSASGVSYPVCRRTGSTSAGTLSVAGTLRLLGGTPYAAMTTLVISGAVEYAAAGNQQLMQATNGGAIPNMYTILSTSGGGTKNLPHAITVQGALGIGTGTTLNAGSHAITHTGPSWTINGVFAAGTGSVTFSGSAAQTFSGAATTFHDLAIGNTNGVALATDVTVNHALSFISGKLLTGSFTVLLGPAASIGGEQAGAGVEGRLSVTHAVGTGASSFGGIGVSIDAGSEDLGSVTVLRISGILGQVSSGGGTSISRRWNITNTGAAPASGRTLTLGWTADDDNGKDLSAVAAWRSTNGGIDWSVASSTQNASMTRTVTASVTAFSDFTVSDQNNPLPVELVSFFGSCRDGIVALRWVTVTEVNNFGFAVERSADAPSGHWERIGFVAGHGSSSVPHRYEFVDREPPASPRPLLYRLCQIDRDGKRTITDDISIHVSDTPSAISSLEVYPNPVGTSDQSATIRIRVTAPSYFTLSIHALSGEQIAMTAHEFLPAGTHLKRFDRGTLPGGKYLLRCETADVVRHRILVVGQ